MGYDATKMRGFRRALCLALAVMMLVPMLPARAAVTHGVVIMDSVIFRKGPTTSDHWDYLDTGWVAEILSTTTADNYTWYQVKTNLPHRPAETQTGYLRGDVFRVMTEAEEAAWLANPVQGSVVIPPAGGAYAVVTLDAANLRQTPGGVGVTALLTGDVVSVSGAASDGWYPVSYRGYTGYMSGAHLRMMTQPEVEAYLAGLPVPGTQTPVERSDGYVRITAGSVNLRNRPGGLTMLQMARDQIIPYFGIPQYVDAIGWLYVFYTPANVYGYVHQDFYQYVDASGNPVVNPPPDPVPTPETDVSGHVKLTKPGVNLRVTPGGESLLQLAINTVLSFTGAPTYSGGYYWVRVQDPASKRFGFVRGDCWIYTDAAGNPVQAPPVDPGTPPVDPGTPPGGTVGGVLTLIKGGVNLRKEPAGAVIGSLDRGTVLNYYGFAQAQGYTWYYVLSDQGAGYLRGDMVSVTPGQTPGEQPTEIVNGYLVVTKSAVNLRRTAGGLTLTQVDRGEVYPIIGPVVSQDAYSWYFVRTANNTGYLRNDCVRQLSAAEVQAYLNGTMPSITPPSGTPGATGHIIFTSDSVNVRVAPSLDSLALGQESKDTVLPYQFVTSSGGKMWYLVTYKNQNAYVQGDFVRIMTFAEYQAWLAGQPLPTPPAPTATPSAADMSDTAITVMDRVLVRKSAAADATTLTLLYKAGSAATLTGAPVSNGGYNWYPVRAGGVNGWIRADMLRVLTKSEKAAMFPGETGDKPVATYRTLRLGMSGEDVVRLQNRLIELKMLAPGNAGGTYNSVTMEAVKEYQRAAGLFVDGYAGQHTQDALYGTVPPGGGDGGSTVDPTLYPVEKVDWFTGDINVVWAVGVTASITDVKTGISFRARRWAGGSHVDAEPLTSADTAAICDIYGVETSQEISDKNLYQRRPLWVTVGGRTFAGSLYGVPHNYPAGDTIPGNDWRGQFCVHFVNSRTHETANVDPDHQKAIQDAYDLDPSRK